MDELISRTELLDKVKEVINPADINQYIVWCKLIKIVEELPTILQTYEWCKGCKEYDTENHCCHRYSSFIRGTLQDNIDAVLEDIKTEITHLHEWAFQREFILRIIDKHISGKEYRMKFPTYEEMGKEIAEKALDEYLYKGKTLREWIEIISAEEKQTNTAEWKIVGKTTLHYECSKCGGAGISGISIANIVDGK